MENKNKLLEPLNILIGNWTVTMKHIAIEEPLTWQDNIEWLENGFILWHWQGKNEVPKATFIIGRNENQSGYLYSMLYYDARGVSRLIEMSLENNTWKFLREGEDFYQRFEGTISEDGTKISGHGELSEDKGNTWKHDYDITYTKLG